MTCLRVLCDGITRSESQDHYESLSFHKSLDLHEYSRLHLFEHLKAFKEEEPTENSKEVAGYVFRLFREKAILESLLKRILYLDGAPQQDFLRVWLIDGGIYQFMPEVFSDIDENNNSNSSELRIWLQENATSSKKLLYPLACVASKIWFTEPSFDTLDGNVGRWKGMVTFMVWILHRYFDLVGGIYHLVNSCIITFISHAFISHIPL